ncbi:energy-coupling factor transporter ATPase [Calorimonas adulescens]|jgi:ABC transporter./Cobalt ATP-binding cassette C terminal.|uniref:Energy-coupling factor transporter ATP-binding protein EcfA2 n=1 Tax=Calorimonas adulescens TaxID=2606906 RepID=A0A5D8QDJ5_9THEO|nr:energy-coupling factor transporter ATPase [Calorimonas adulescens]TZE82750.1 energy-coupling factor transporter ATPase [Calorimonas adulescens]
MSIKMKNVSYIYGKGTPFETIALDNIDLEINDGEFIGLIGHTGSGKSTLIQHMNGLLKPTSGKIFVDGTDITEHGVNLKEIRRKVGLVFQYPEHQLFEETVFKDVAFGPMNQGVGAEEIEERVKWALTEVGLDYDSIKDVSPFELSGGERRRVAIAGVLSMHPEVLILDEPTSGLDPRGRDDILEKIKSLNSENGITVVLVSHSMEDVARLSDRLIVMNRGKIILTGRPREVFKESKLLMSVGLGVPQMTLLFERLRERGWDVRDDVLTVEEARDDILKKVGLDA